MKRTGFSLIELLVVIAIIAILAAIIFPVYAQAKKGAYKSSDLSNMNAIRTALQLYKADNGAFPPALLGFVGPYSNVSGGNVVPPNAVRDALYPKRIESLTVLRPALNRIPDNPGTVPYNPAVFSYTSSGNAAVTGAYWPGVGSGLAGDPSQRYGSSDKVMRAAYASDGTCSSVPSFFYRISGYDVAPATNQPGANMETHYQLFWTGYTVPANPCAAVPGGAGVGEQGSASDNPRQLGYSEPPESTVVTWNPFFRDYQNGLPVHQRQDLVLFVGGSARPMDSRSVYDQAWGIQP